jgi:hypothetical protein
MVHLNFFLTFFVFPFSPPHNRALRRPWPDRNISCRKGRRPFLVPLTRLTGYASIHRESPFSTDQGKPRCFAMVRICSAMLTGGEHWSGFLPVSFNKFKQLCHCRLSCSASLIRVLKPVSPTTWCSMTGSPVWSLKCSTLS